MITGVNNKVATLLNQAVAQHKLGQKEAAIDFYLKSLELDKNLQDWVYENLIILLSQVDRTSQALSLGENALKIHANSDKVYRAMGLTFNRQGNFKNSINCYLTSLRIEQNQPDWLYASLIEMLVEANQLQQAIQVGSLGMKIHNNRPWICYHLGQACSALEQWEAALSYYKKAAAIQSDLPNIQDKINLTVEKVRKDNRQIKTTKTDQINNNLNFDLKNQQLRQQINYCQTQAVAKHKAGQTEEAINFYLKAISLDNRQPAWVYENTIILLANIGNLDQGLQLGENAEKLHPKSDEVYRALGLLYEKQKALVNSIKKYRKSIELKAMQPDWVYCNLAKQLLQNGEAEEAVKICQKGIQIYQSFYPLYYTLAEAFAAQEQWTQTISYYRKVQELNPDWQEIEQDLSNAIYQKNLAARLINNEQYQSGLTVKNNTINTNQATILAKKLTRNYDSNLDINLLFRKLEEGVLDFASCQRLWANYQGNKLILNYGCWLSPNIIYLEATPESYPVVNQAEILVVSPHKYGIAQANFFPLPPQQVAGVVCFAEDLYLEDFASYNLYLKYNDTPVLVEGTVQQKAFNLEFIEYLKTKPAQQKHLIRESVSQSIISLIPEHFKPTAKSFLEKIQYFLDITPANYVDPNLPFKIFIDYIIPLKYDGLFISGWLQDAYQMLEEITVISALGFSLKLSRQDIYWLERRDVNEFLHNTRYGDFQGNLGFCVYAAVPDDIRQSIAGFAQLHSFRFLVRLKGNIEIEIIPDAKYSDFYNARQKVMQIASSDKVSESMLTNCIAPVALKLQQLCTEQVKIKDLTVIGTPVTKPLVSIIIPLYRRLDFMKIQLVTMANDPGIKQCEIIYVLDSPEQEKELRNLLLNHCQLYQLSVKLIVMEHNSGYAATNNAGASQALGKYLVLLNSDVFARTKGWMLKMAQFYASSAKIGVLGAKLIYEDGAIQHAGMFFAQTTYPFYLNLHYYKGLPGNYTLAQKTRAVPAVTGACLMIEKELYDIVGGLTTDYIIGDFEDSDLCFKCRALGYESWYCADATLYHLERQSVPLNSSYNGSLAWRLNGHLHQERWGEEIAALMSIYQ